MIVETIKISIKEKIGYSVGDTASNLYFQTWMLFLLYFYTDVFGIPAAAVGTMFLVTRIWDAINDPIMGMIADRTNTKWGKFRPYLLWLALPFGILGVLMFTTPDFSVTGKVVYAYITYTAMMMIYTAINVPYSALMGVITPNALERTGISSFRFVAAFVGGLIVQASTMTLVKTFGGDNETVGWSLAMLVLSVLAVILFLITFFTTKERVQPPAGQKTPLKQDLKDLFTNMPWILIAIATVFQLTHIVIRNGSIMYYFKYFVQDSDVILFGKSYSFGFETLASSFMLFGSVATILGAILAKWFTKVFDKRNTFAGFFFLSALAAASFYVLGPQHIVLMFLLNLLYSFFMGPVAVLQWSIYTDTADYSEWKNGRRATGLLMSASLFALKLGVAIGGAVSAWLLAGYGFVPNQDQAEKALQGIRMLMTIFPAIAGLGGVVTMFFYPLNNKRMLEIEADLTERRKGA